MQWSMVLSFQVQEIFGSTHCRFQVAVENHSSLLAKTRCLAAQITAVMDREASTALRGHPWNFL